MIFEVDNTTEKIINSLQNSIEGNLQGIHDDQAAICKEISLLKNEISQEDVLDSVRDVSNKLIDLDDKVQNIKNNNDDTLIILDNIKTLLTTIESKVDYSEEFNKVFHIIEELEEKTILLNQDVSIIKNTNLNIVERVDNLLVLVNEYNTKIEDLGEKENSIISQLNESSQKENSTLSALSEIKKQIEEQNVNITQIKNLETELSEKSDLILNSINNNREFAEKINESINSNGRKIDELVQMSNENVEENNYQKKQIDIIIEYLKKPGIARFFKGLKGE